MALLERVATLIRANLNDLIDKAENPEVMIKQVIQDMNNQLMQVKTQVALAITDQHVLEKKQKENREKAAEWQQKAEAAVDRNDDDMARLALERGANFHKLAEEFAQQVADQKIQVEDLKSALRQLQEKLHEAQSKSDLLLTRHRRARAVQKAAEAQLKADNDSSAATFDRMKAKIRRDEALGEATAELVKDDVERRFQGLEKSARIEKMLAELKARRKS